MNREQKYFKTKINYSFKKTLQNLSIRKLFLVVNLDQKINYSLQSSQRKIDEEMKKEKEKLEKVFASFSVRPKNRAKPTNAKKWGKNTLARIISVVLLYWGHQLVRKEKKRDSQNDNE